MRHIRARLHDLLDAGEPFAMATVVETRRSSPREPATAMAVSADGEIVGDVSAGCVEGAVVDACAAVLDTGWSHIERYGFSDEQAFQVGLTCGGELDVFIERIDATAAGSLRRTLEAIDADRPVALATVVAGDAAPTAARLTVEPDRTSGTLSEAGLDAAVTEDARALLEHGTSALRTYGPDGQREMEDVSVFIAVFVPPPRLLVFGATDLARAVARIGKFLGHRVTVCDARAPFATQRRFPEADEVVVEWPHRYLQGLEVDARTSICVLTHDPKFDVPLLEVALGTTAGYIGVLGSRTTHEDRLARLRAAGVPDGQLARLRSPVGLDIGARTSEEVAVAIAAEIVADMRGGSGSPLRTTAGRIHDPSRNRTTA